MSKRSFGVVQSASGLFPVVDMSCEHGIGSLFAVLAHTFPIHFTTELCYPTCQTWLCYCEKINVYLLLVLEMNVIHIYSVVCGIVEYYKHVYCMYMCIALSSLGICRCAYRE